MQEWKNSKKIKPTVSLQPKAGMAICFYHNILHQGGNVTSGQKYIMRTDVLFERVDSGADASPSSLELLQLAEDMERAKKIDLAVKYYSMVRLYPMFVFDFASLFRSQLFLRLQAYKLDPSLENAHFGNWKANWFVAMY